MNNQWKVIEHPLIKDNLTKLRDKNTKKIDFAASLKIISNLLIFEVCKNIKTKLKTIHTPFVETQSPILSQKIILISILRAGLGMLESFKEILPNAKIGHIGLKRSEEKFNFIQQYYLNLPEINDNDYVIVLDPMIATGNSAIKAINEIRKINNQSKIIFVSIIVSKISKQNIDQKIKNISFFTTATDPKLNKKQYIIPGLGDAGDRFFGT